MYQTANTYMQNSESTAMPIVQPLTRFAATGCVQVHEPVCKPQASIAVIRHYLTHLSSETLEAQAFTDELAMRAKIIAEYMQRHTIKNVNQGIREFTAFERERLQCLGLLAVPQI